MLYLISTNLSLVMSMQIKTKLTVFVCNIKKERRKRMIKPLLMKIWRNQYSFSLLIGEFKSKALKMYFSIDPSIILKNVF